MATVNKSSLRAEFDALKARFESLCAAGKMSAESRALFDALLMLFELLMAVFMEKHTPKSSANSSLPASQSPNDDTARTRPGAKGKGPSPSARHRREPPDPGPGEARVDESSQGKPFCRQGQPGSCTRDRGGRSWSARRSDSARELRQRRVMNSVG